MVAGASGRDRRSITDPIHRNQAATADLGIAGDHTGASGLCKRDSEGIAIRNRM